MTATNFDSSSSLSNPDFDFEVARIVIEKGYATKEQVQDCMKEQHTLLQQGQSMQLGQILIRKKYLTVAQFLQMVPKNQPQPEVVECTECHAKFNVSSKASGTKFRCKHCKSVLVVPEKSQATVQATVSPAPKNFQLSQEETQIQPSSQKSSQKGSTASISEETRIQSSRGSNSLGKSASRLSSGALMSTNGGERRFGKYEILEEIARGGMGIVYKAKQIDFNRVVALKVMKQGEFSSEEQIARFRREAQAAARLNHPNIIPIHEIGEVEGNHYFTMDYIEGTPLNESIKGKPLSIKKIIQILKEIAEGLEEAHRNQIVHRDLKPANILLDEQGHPKITDFGLAKVLDDQAHLTQSNAVVGTPYYMSPEQTRGESDKIDARTDVYALGVLAYHLLTKRLPFTGNSTMEIYHKINNTEPRPPSEINNKIDPILSAILRKAMSKDIEARYDSAQAFAEDLARYEAKEKVLAYQKSSKKTLLFLVFGLLFGAISFALFWKFSLQEPVSEIKSISNEDREKQIQEEQKRLAEELRRKEQEQATSLLQEKQKIEEEYISRFREGEQFLARADYHNALPCFQRCNQLFPERFEPYFQIGMSHYRLDQDREAVEAFQKAIELNARFSETHYWLGYTLYRQNHFDEALESFKKAIQYNPEDMRYYQARATMYRKKESWALAISDYKTILKLNPEDTTANFELGAIYTFRKRDYDLAIQYYTKCIEIKPDMIIARYNRGVCQVLKKNFEAAFVDFNDSYEIDPDKVHQLVERSLSREQNSSEFGYSSAEVDKLVEQLFSSLDLSKPDPLHFLYMGIYYFYRNDFKKGAQVLSLSIQMNPQDEKPLVFRGLCYGKLKDFEKAIRDFNAVLKKKPKDLYTRIYLGQAYLDMGQYSKALGEYERVLNADRKNVRALHKIGFIHLINNEYEEALEQFDTCLLYNNKYPYAYSLKAYLMMKTEKLNEAVSLIDEALKIDFYNAYHWGILGEIELAQGHKEKAKEAFEKALSFGPTDHYFSRDYYEKLLATLK